MIKTIVFNGGLGNQMFQYAFYLRLKKEYPFSMFVFDIEGSKYCHDGFQLDNIFKLDSKTKIRFFAIIKKHFSNIYRGGELITNHGLQYNPTCVVSHSFLSIYKGYWQTEKYFADIENTIRHTFSFDKQLLNKRTKALSALINTRPNCVSVHIRRGDYLDETNKDFGICPIDYYTKAISYFKTKTEKPLFVFFSDDIVWVKENIKVADGIYVDWNIGNDSWQDMYLMSKCRHNIIANSSFSWWGAWLNNNTGKIVITPKRWFRSTQNYDIIPSSWITL